MNSYKDLLTYQKAVDLIVRVYEMIRAFPKEETYGLCDQLRRAVVSIPSNIAEGSRRGSRKEYVQFLRIALGSCAEVETQLLVSYKLGYISPDKYRRIQVMTDEISRMLLSMIKKLSPTTYKLQP